MIYHGDLLHMSPCPYLIPDGLYSVCVFPDVEFLLWWYYYYCRCSCSALVAATTTRWSAAFVTMTAFITSRSGFLCLVDAESPVAIGAVHVPSCCYWCCPCSFLLLLVLSMFLPSCCYYLLTYIICHTVFIYIIVFSLPLFFSF